MKMHSENTDAKLKIGLVLDDTLDSTDGVQQYVITIGSWLKEQGHEVHYLTGQSARTDIKNVHSLSRNIKVRFNGNRLSIPLPASKKKIKEVLANQFDILHVQAPFSPFLAGRVISSANKQTAIIGTFHIAPYGKLAKTGARMLGILSRAYINRFDKMLAVSAPAASMAEEIYNTKATVLGNCFDFELFHSAKPFKRNDNRLEILFLGRLVKRKGCQTLLSALALLERSSNDAQDYHLTIVGDGPLRPQLEQYVRDNNLGDKVQFVGYIEEKDKPRYYASADISVFPSISGESFGFVLVEAMANGNSAIIAANNPGYAALLKANSDMLFKAGDEVELTSKLKDYMYNPELRKQIAANGLNVAASFDQEVIASKLVDYYRESLRKRSA